jgi:rRNA-processing protein FCF1
MVLEELKADDADLPELRVGKPGRSGSRFWLYGRRKKAFRTRLPYAQFDELRRAGLLTKLRDEASGTYFAFTPEAFRRRDQIVARESADLPLEAIRPAQPPVELTGAEPRLAVLQGLARSARKDLDALIAVSQITETVKNEPGSGVVYIPKHWWRWLELEPEHRVLLGRAQRSLGAWLEAVGVTLAIAGPEHLERFRKEAETLRRFTDRSDSSAGPPAGDPSSAGYAAHAALDKHLDLLDALPAAHEHEELIVVPDTNALLADAAIEDWSLGDEHCGVVIVAEVQAELDAKKRSTNERIAERAASLIRRFREYGRRGDTLEGVSLVGRRQFRELPVQPDMSKAPGWLDAGHADDRILAAALELASRHLTSRVVLVTRDRGLQNKARNARLPAVDVEDL